MAGERMTLLERMTSSPTRQSCATCALARKTLRAPTIVREPPPAMPDLIVTPSRIRQSSPDCELTRSPRYLRSCEVHRRSRRTEVRMRAPMSVRPATLTCEISRTPSPSVAPGRRGKTDRRERRRRDARPIRRKRWDEQSVVRRRAARGDAHSSTSIAEIISFRGPGASTLASPRNHHMFRRLAVRVMWYLT